MFSFFRSKKPTSNGAGVYFLAISVLHTALISMSLSAFANNTPAPKPELSHFNSGPNPDLLLIEVYKNLANNRIVEAQSQIDALLTAYPNFQLGHLIRGDLIAMRAKPSTQLGAAVSGNDKLSDLRAEAIARIRAITEKPAPDLIPINLLSLADDQKYVLAMDAQRARLYLYENVNGVPILRSDYYVSQGKFGVDKAKEGDQRTPLGVYFITNRVAGAKLPDFYGPGALPLNYPNEWDKLRGRGGSGIWLHGVPSTNYSRPPLASDGCVVLTNPDFLKISATVDIAKTPVIISDRLNFVSRQVWMNEKTSARKLLDLWRQDFASVNPVFLSKHYSRNFKNANGDNASTWIQKQYLGLQGINDSAVKIREQSQFKYPGREDMIVNFFTQEINTARGPANYKRRQYWAKEGSQWVIVFEESNFISGVKPEIEVAKNDKPKAEPFKESVASLGNNNPTLASQAAKSRQNNDKKNSQQTQAEVLKTVDHWLSVWAAKNTKAYLAHYAKDFQTPGGESRKSWMEERKSRIEGKGKITVRYESPVVTMDGNIVTVKFRQHYQSGALVASSRKTLIMVKQDGKWLIKQEKTGS